MTFLSAAPFGRKDFDGSCRRRIRIGRERWWCFYIEEDIKLYTLTSIFAQDSTRFTCYRHSGKPLSRFIQSSPRDFHISSRNYRFNHSSHLTTITFVRIFLRELRHSQLVFRLSVKFLLRPTRGWYRWYGNATISQGIKWARDLSY